MERDWAAVALEESIDETIERAAAPDAWLDDAPEPDWEDDLWNAADRVYHEAVDAASEGA